MKPAFFTRNTIEYSSNVYKVRLDLFYELLLCQGVEEIFLLEWLFAKLD